MRPTRTGRRAKRRTFLHLLSAAGGAAALGELAACGGGERASREEPDAGTSDGAVAPADGSATGVTIEGTIDASQFGGAGLRIHSAHRIGALVVDGRFTTAISGTAPQLLFVADAMGRLRGLAIAQPGDATVTVDARSTALAIVFGSLGILTVEPAEARARVAKIGALPAFEALVTTCAARLPSQDLVTLAADAELTNRRDEVVTAFHGTAQASAAIDRGFVSGAFMPASATNDHAAVTLSNAGWRFVAVARQELAKDRTELRASVPRLTRGQNPLPPAAPSLLSGTNPATWGNLLFAQTGGPGTAIDSVDPGTDVATYAYWVVGPGAAKSGKTLPASVHLSPAAPIIGTVLFYLFAPLLDLTGGGAAMLGVLGRAKALTDAEELTAAFYAAGLNTAGLEAALNSADAGNVKAGLVDLAASMVGLAGPLLLAAGIAEAPLALTVLATVLAGGSGLFGVFNLGKLVESLLSSPGVAVVEVPATPAPRFTVRKITDEFLGGAWPHINTLGHVIYSGYPDATATTGNTVAFWLDPLADKRVQISDEREQLAGLSNLSDQDHCVVTTVDLATGVQRAQLWDGVRARDIGSLASSPRITYGAAIDEADGIAAASNVGGLYHLCRWDAGPDAKLRDLGIEVPNQPGTQTAIVMNAHGQIACYAGNALTAQILLIDDDGTSVEVTNEGMFGALGLNDAGQVAFTDIRFKGHLWQNGVDTELPLPPVDAPSADAVIVLALNEHGWVVGQGGPMGTDLLLWIDGAVHYVRDLIDDYGDVDALDSGGVAAINARGQIVTRGLAGGKDVLVLLTPKQG